jgi:hypothetical protein
MGGSAYLIWGSLTDERIRDLSKPRGILGRLFRRDAGAGPKWAQFMLDKEIADLPPDDLRDLGPAFRSYLGERLDPPWPATTAVLEYLDIGTVSVYLRGERSHGSSSADWYVQLTFSGCAGQAEISAEVATHWAAIWYQERSRHIIAQHLMPFGFIPGSQRDEGEDRPCFVPINDLGYGKYVGTQFMEEWGELTGSRMFETDASVSELLEPQGRLPEQRRLDETLGPLMEDGRCRCQMCMPEFDPVTLPGLVS